MTEGTKYHPLFERLLFSGQGHISMTFNEIEDVIGQRLPPSARQREEWWSNSARGHSQARAWMRASYKTARVDLASEKVEFKLEGWPEGYAQVSLPLRLGDGGAHGFGETGRAKYTPRQDGDIDDHPLFGIWEGKVTLLSGYDYTKPAFDPDERL